MALVVRNLHVFEEFRRKLLELPHLVPIAAKRIGVALMKEAQEGFRRSVDPYDRPWAPVLRNRIRDRRARARRARAGKPARDDKPLVDTGRLRASVIARADGAEVRIALPVEYASYHQYGTRFIRRRQMLPESDTGGLGPRWSRAANREALAVLNEHFEKGG